MLSRRLLYLTQSETFFCNGRDWKRESRHDLIDSKQIFGPLANFKGNESRDGRDDHMFRYCWAVEEYSSRDLAYPSDILRAFTGIYTRFCEIFSCASSIDATKCIPPHLIPEALIWTSKSAEKYDEARKAEVNVNVHST